MVHLRFSLWPRYLADLRNVPGSGVRQTGEERGKWLLLAPGEALHRGHPANRHTRDTADAPLLVEEEGRKVLPVYRVVQRAEDLRRVMASQERGTVSTAGKISFTNCILLNLH